MKSMHLKRSIAVILMLGMLVSGMLSAQMETFPFVGYTSDTVPILQDASQGAQQTGTIPALSSVSVTGEDGDYYIAVYEGKIGYVPKNALSTTLPEKSAVPTPRVANAQAAANYPALQKGDSGETVTALQQALIELGFLRGKADGKYGTATETAVSSFQKKNSLPVNGRADSVTQQMMFEKTVINSRGKKQTVKTVAASLDDTATKLRLNDRGLPVEKLQKALKDLGYYTGNVDGVYGRGTKTAVIAFQKANQLRTDGVAGAKTLALLYGGAALKKGETPAPQSTALLGANVPSVSGNSAYTDGDQPATYPYQTTTLDSVNMRKSASTRSMRILTVPRGADITVTKDGDSFLYVQYKKYTGYVLKEYVNIPEQYLEGKSFKSDTAARVRYETLTQGASGAAVKALQTALKDLGFYNGKEDGSFGSDTTQAVRRFQEKNGYKATGIALPEMQKLIYEGRCRNASNRMTRCNVLPPIENPDMTLGNKGDAVAELQRTLTTLGFFKDVIDGIYGKTTANAVRAYQKAHSIKETGKMNSFTWLSLNAVTNKGNTQTLPEDQNQLTEANVIVMRRGTRGLAVTRLQERLVALGYYAKVPNGVYEANDMEAVRAFQRNNGITSSGIADLITQQVLYSAEAVPGSATPPENWQSLATPSPAPATPAPIYETLKLGSAGEAVKALQSRLISLQYLTGNADGQFGTQTAQAVTAFQKSNGLKADGIAGAQTLTAVYSAKAQANAPAPSVPQDGNLTRVLGIGDRGNDVADAQRRLIVLNYLDGSADGVYGPKTALAVQAFQQRNSLKADGFIGSLTWAKLNSARAIAGGLSPLTPLTPIVPTPDSNANNNTQAFSAPRASEVRFASWYEEIKGRARSLPNVTIYDFMTGKHYDVHIFSNGKHADGEPVTAQDTATMESALGASNWTPRPVWVMFSDGRVYMASTHSRGHEVDHNPHNNLTGHICIHFPRQMEEAQQTGPYAVSHQNAILAGWDLTQQMAK